MAHGLQSVDEGRKQFFIPSRITSKNGASSSGLAVRTAPEHDRVVSVRCSLRSGCSWPSSRSSSTGPSVQLETARSQRRCWILIGEQPAHIQIAPAGQGGPDDLIAQAGDPHGVGAGKCQHSAQGIRLRNGRIKQQRFLIQGSSPELGLALVGAGGGGGVKARRRIDPPQA